MSGSLQDMEGDLTCSICVDVFKEPVMLPCQHSFCRKCLMMVSTKTDSTEDEHDIKLQGKHKREDEITCPICRAKVELGEKGVAGLIVHFALANIAEKYQARLKEESKVPNCSICEEDENLPAVKFCTSCCIYYCQECLIKIHPMKGPLRRHKLLSIEEHLSDQTDVGKSECDLLSADALPFPVCTTHRQKFSLYCGTCDQLLCNSCFNQHNDHRMNDVSTAYLSNKIPLEDQTKDLKQLKTELYETMIVLTTFSEDLQKQKSLHLSEIESSYQKTLEMLESWRTHCLLSVEKRYEDWSLGTEAIIKNLNIKLEETEALTQKSGVLLSGPDVILLQESSRMKSRIEEVTSSTKEQLQLYSENTTKWREDMDKDVVLPKYLYLCEDFGAPRLKFVEILSDSVEIRDGGRCLSNIEQGFGKQFKGALTDGRFQTGRHYWEMDVCFNVKQKPGDGNLLCSAGVVHKSSHQGKCVGDDINSWGVRIRYRDIHYEYACRHNGTDLRPPSATFPDVSTKTKRIHLGFYLDCGERTLTVLNCTGSRILHLFGDLDLSQPLIPAVTLHNFKRFRSSVSMVACDISVLPDHLTKILSRDLSRLET